MKSPIDTVTGKIVDISDTGDITIKVHYSDYTTLIRREYKECSVQFIDSRKLSVKQRKMCYAMLHAISDYTGMGLDSTKEIMKIKFLVEELQETADKIFSLSNAPMSLVCAFQNFLVRFIIEFEIPTTRPLLDYVDDVEDYVYTCAVNKKCCICGLPAEAHHHKRIGMGADRKTMNHMGLMIEPLCREHHMQCHDMLQEDFDAAWHIVPVEVDKVIAKVFNLNTKSEEEDNVVDIL